MARFIVSVGVNLRLAEGEPAEEQARAAERIAVSYRGPAQRFAAHEAALPGVSGGAVSSHQRRVRSGVGVARSELGF